MQQYSHSGGGWKTVSLIHMVLRSSWQALLLKSKEDSLLEEKKGQVVRREKWERGAAQDWVVVVKIQRKRSTALKAGPPAYDYLVRGGKLPTTTLPSRLLLTEKTLRNATTVVHAPVLRSGSGDLQASIGRPTMYYIKS